LYIFHKTCFDNSFVLSTKNGSLGIHHPKEIQEL